MDQRLRLVQSNSGRYEKRAADRYRITVPGQIVWKDARGNTQVTSVVTRDVSEHGVSVECEGGRPIPLYRLVFFQIDRQSRHRADLPATLRNPSVLSAVFRVGPCSEATGSPAEYGLRLLVEPQRQASSAPSWTAQTGKMATA